MLSSSPKLLFLFKCQMFSFIDSRFVYVFFISYFYIHFLFMLTALHTFLHYWIFFSIFYFYEGYVFKSRKQNLLLTLFQWEKGLNKKKHTNVQEFCKTFKMLAQQCLIVGIVCSGWWAWWYFPAMHDVLCVDLMILNIVKLKMLLSSEIQAEATGVWGWLP